MDSCREAQAQITPYLDEECCEGEREVVQSHLRECDACRADAAAQDLARRVVQTRAALLRVKAPEGLRARCAGLAPTPGRAWLAGWSAWRVASLATATAMGVLVAVVAFGVATHSPVLLAAELTLDHLKCFGLFDPGPTPDGAAAVEAAVHGRFGWRTTVPPGEPGRGLVLLGARRCLSHDGSVAHIMYRHAGRPVSLFVMPSDRDRRADLAVGGYPAHIWTRGDLAYVLVASEPDETLRPVMAYFSETLK